MDFKQFKTIIETLEKVRDRSHSIYQLGVDLINYDEPYHVTISTLIESIFDEDGKGWIDWYLYERSLFKDTNNHAWDENGKAICYDIPSLWETVKPYRKQ